MADMTPVAVEFRGPIKKPNDLSGLVAVGPFLAIVSDEAKNPSIVQLLKKDGAGYAHFRDVVLAPAGPEEVDLEGLAADGHTVYVTGSHASARKIEDGVIGEPKRKKSREQFFRFHVNDDGTTGLVQGPKTLTDVIHAHPVLKGFVGIASKENGVDIEGIGVKAGRLYFGFRSPVLRYGFVPVLSCTWDDPQGTAQTLYLQLGGRGIRDLEAVAGGFLVLAGPPGDSDGTFRLYFWDGQDRLNVSMTAGLQDLLEFPPLGAGHPEAITILSKAGSTYDILLLCDGLPGGGPTRWQVTIP